MTLDRFRTAAARIRRHFQKSGTTGAASDSATPSLLRLALVGLPALGGVGGVVAAIEYCSAARPSVGLYATVNSDSLYTLEQDDSRSRIAIVPLERLSRELQQRPDSTTAIVDLTFEITNLGKRPISAHALAFELNDITPLLGRRLIVVSNGNPLTQDELSSHGLKVNVLQSQGRILILQALGTDPVEEVISRLQSSLRARIDSVTPDVPGSTHSEPFLRTETVTHVLSDRPHRYEVPVNHRVTPNDTVQVPVQWGAEQPLSGSGRILLRYNSTSELVLADQFMIQITPAPQTRLTTEHPDDTK